MYVFPMIGHMTPLQAFLLLIAFWLAAYLFSKFLRRSLRNGPKHRPASRAVRRPSASGEYDALVNMCLGDRDKVERLITYEMTRRPGLTRSQAISEAADRLRYDRSR